MRIQDYLHPMSHEEKVDYAYEMHKGSASNNVYPGGKNQANAIIVSFAKINNFDLRKSDKEFYARLLHIYMGLFVRFRMMFLDNKADESCGYCAKYLQEAYGDFFKTTNAEKTAIFFVLNRRDPSFSLEDPKAENLLNVISMYPDFIRHHIRHIEFIRPNIFGDFGMEATYIQDDAYGLTADKPIYAQHIAGSKAYLAALKTPSGEGLTWTRKGSICEKNLKKPIDVYHGVTPQGTSYGPVYINMYGTYTSEKPPKGFLFRP